MIVAERFGEDIAHRLGGRLRNKTHRTRCGQDIGAGWTLSPRKGDRPICAACRTLPLLGAMPPRRRVDIDAERARCLAVLAQDWTCTAGAATLRRQARDARRRLRELRRLEHLRANTDWLRSEAGPSTYPRFRVAIKAAE